MPTPNLLDLVIVLIVVTAVIRGYRSGFAVQVGGLVGFLVGLIVGAWFAPYVAGFVDDPSATVLVTLVTLFVVAFGIGASGEWVGLHVAAGARRVRLGAADEIAGAVFSGVFTLLVVWLLSSSLASAPLGGVGALIQRSAVIDQLDQFLPPVPSVLSRLGRLTDPLGVPRVFVGIEPPAAPPVDPPTDAEVLAAARAAEQSTVQVLGRGCGGTLVGSAFVAAPGLVVTNAHVIAGLDAPRVRDGGGTHDARPVLFDPDVDLALLAVDDLAGPPLPLAPSELPRGTVGAVLGFPGGGSFTVGAAAITAGYEARGRDIYGEDLVRRDVYELQATVRPGNSGGPFVLADGRVGAVVFARSVKSSSGGYALSAEEVTPLLASVTALSPTVDTGPCAAG